MTMRIYGGIAWINEEECRFLYSSDIFKVALPFLPVSCLVEFFALLERIRGEIIGFY